MRFWWLNFWWNGWNGLAFAWFITGFVAGLLTYSVAGRFLGESDSAKAVSWLVSGSTIMVADMAYRIAMSRSVGKRAFVHWETGGWGCLLPRWGFGLLIVVAGIYMYRTAGYCSRTSFFAFNLASFDLVRTGFYTDASESGRIPLFFPCVWGNVRVLLRTSPDSSRGVGCGRRTAHLGNCEPRRRSRGGTSRNRLSEMHLSCLRSDL